MKRFTINTGIALVLGLGIAIALVWLVNGPSTGLPISRAAGPWYVAPGGDDDGDCLSTSTPCATINGALAKPGFMAGDTILVAMGTYSGDGNEVVLLDKSASLSGGWDDTFTTQSGASTIDGEESRRGITVNSGVTVTVERFVVQNGVHVFYYDGAGISSSGHLTLKNSRITDNNGNGLYLYSNMSPSDATLINNIIADNDGHGLDLSLTTAALTNNIIADNADNGLYIRGSSARLLHTTIARNTGSGGGMYVTGYCSMGCAYSTVAMTNTILVGHTAGVYVESGNTTGLEGTLWGSGVWANDTDWSGDGTIITGTVNLWDDPDFENPGSGDYHIGPDSAALDAGVDAGVDDDIDGEPRPRGSGYDIGADELPDTILRLHKAVGPSVLLKPGQTLTYTLGITSTGVETATGVWLTDTLPILQRAVDITTTHGSCTISAGWGGTTTCNLGTMAAGDSALITLTAQVTTTPPVQLPVLMRNTAWVKAIETTSRSAYADTTLHDCHARLNDSPIEYETVQAAVDASTQPTDIVKVAGTCTGVTLRDGLTQIVYLSKTLTLQGGWNTAFTQRNVISFPTTLDAQEQGRVLYITGEVSPTVEGLRITGGNAAGLGGDTACDIWCYDVDAGGGIYIITATATISNNQVFNNTADEGIGGGLHLKDSDATIRGNTITNNTAEGGESGGGLHLKDSDATIISNTITNNYEVGLHLEGSDATISGNTITNNYGGGLHLKDSDATIISNTITNNTAGDGGGLYLENSAATIRGNTISSNSATAWGENNGGGLCLIFSNATLSGNTVISNTANGSGGGVYLGIGSDATLSGNTVISNTANGNGGGVCLEDTDNATLSGNAVIFNTTNGSGGGMYMKDSGATIINNTITDNTADGGGGMYLESSGPTIRGNTITNNSSNGECGGLYLNSNNITLTNNIVANNQANAGGSGLCIRGSSIYLLHNTIVRNIGGDGSGVYVFDYWGNSTATLINTILVSHTVGVHVTEGSTATLEGTLWGSGIWANGSDWDGDGDIITGTVNLWGAPVFVDPDAGNYHISPGSAAVDAGVEAGVPDDIDGDLRADVSPDIGADELLTSALIVTKQAEPDPVRSGGQLTYTIRITNTGGVTLTATITDTLPDDIVQGETPGGTLIVPSGIITWTPVVIVPRDVWSYTFVVTVEVGYAGPLTNVVDVTTEEGATDTYTHIATAEEPITGLTVSNDSPTELGDATTLTATVTMGSNVSYAWAFGDGETGSGAMVTHTYPNVGVFTAVVTASNSVSLFTETTTITITDVPIVGLVATNDSPTKLRNATTLTATITAGSNVSYTWAFGDGETASGRVVTHTYPHIDVFTAVVTASNSVSLVAVPTTVTITTADFYIYLPLVLRNH